MTRGALSGLRLSTVPQGNLWAKILEARFKDDLCRSMQLEIFKSKLRLDPRSLIRRCPLQPDFDARIDHKTPADSH